MPILCQSSLGITSSMAVIFLGLAPKLPAVAVWPPPEAEWMLLQGSVVAPAVWVDAAHGGSGYALEEAPCLCRPRAGGKEAQNQGRMGR